jgi:alkylated DNA nucleotide flippase Atl1
MNVEYVEAVLAVVRAVPPGQVTSYGTVADVIGHGGARQVGRVMSAHGQGVPWWRVVHADGSPPTCHNGAAVAILRAEGTPILSNGRIDMRAAAAPVAALRSR